MHGSYESEQVEKRDHFPMLLMDQILDRQAEKGWYYFLDGYLGYNQIMIALEDQEKTNYTYHYGIYALRGCRSDYAIRLPLFRYV